jgi:hypothetical protein
MTACACPCHSQKYEPLESPTNDVDLVEPFHILKEESNKCYDGTIPPPMPTTRIDLLTNISCRDGRICSKVSSIRAP